MTFSIVCIPVSVSFPVATMSIATVLLLCLAAASVVDSARVKSVSVRCSSRKEIEIGCIHWGYTVRTCTCAWANHLSRLAIHGATMLLATVVGNKMTRASGRNIAESCFLLSWSLENPLFPSFWSQLRTTVFYVASD